MMRNEFEVELERMVNFYLEDYSLEELFEVLNIDPAEAINKLFYAGMINEDDLAMAFEIPEEDFDE